MKYSDKVVVFGFHGLVGSAIMRRLEKDGYLNVIGIGRAELDLCDQKAVFEWFETEKPSYVFLAAAKVGGILANKMQKADFILQNLKIETNVIEAAWRSGVEKMLFLGSSCIYPKHCPQPIKEEYLLTGTLEETNDAYAIAKIAGIKLCESLDEQYGTSFLSVMPTNLYGPNDNFDPQNSHVLPAMIRKFEEARLGKEPKVVLWGTGTPKREFLHVDDLADAVVFLMNNYYGKDIVNIGTGQDISIRELAGMIKEAVGYEGDVAWDSEKPDGTPRKLLDVSRLHSLGWKHKIGLQDGIKSTIDWYLKAKQEKG